MSHHRLLWFAYICFVIYGSLVPLDFQPRPFDEAWAAFRHLPMLEIGVEGRADWVANGVLYLPVGFLTVALFAHQEALFTRLLILFGSVLFFSGLALTIEFTQLFFPPRTVSLNDVIAECVGGLLGSLFALHWSQWFRDLFITLAGKLHGLAARSLQVYALGYVIFSFFPYDVLLSWAEVDAKIQSDAWGWFLSAETTNRGIVILLVKLLAETLAVVPLGLMLGRLNETKQKNPVQKVFVSGIAIGLIIEIGQFFIFSGVSQGASLLTRASGMHLGAMLWGDRAHWSKSALASQTKRFIFQLGISYFGLLGAVNGCFDHPWEGIDFASKNLSEIHFLPFYYHYFTTEQAALLSLVSVCAMYAPIAGFFWVLQLSPAMALWTATVAATVIETAKLFIEGLHPDPTNIAIAALAVWTTSKMLLLLHESSTRAAGRSSTELGPRGSASPVATQAQPSGDRLVVESVPPPPIIWLPVLVVLGVTTWIVCNFPIYPIFLGLSLAAYAALIWFRPYLLFVVIPAALPLLDLVPWSGRIFIDEFDLLVAVSVSIGFVRTRPAARGKVRDWLVIAIFGLVAVSYVIAAFRGLLPWRLPDANAFNNYYSPYNALRIAKGTFWAFLLFGLCHRLAAMGHDIRRLFSMGMIVGLAGTVAVIFWERIAFPGFFNFSDIYRVTGPFSQMHTGGAEIECFLTAAAPFIVLAIARSKNILTRIAGALLLLGATYAVMVTFSRAGYAGFAVALMVAGLAIAAVPGQRRTWTPVRAGAALSLATLVLLVIGYVYSGPFAKERMANASSDLGIRQAHWADALQIRDQDMTTALLGMGLGRFPETHFWRSSEPRAASYQLQVEAENTFLRLGSGSPLYMEQFVALEPNHTYWLKLAIRSPRTDASLTITVCEKWLLTSANCISQTLRAAPNAGSWESHKVQLATGDLSAGPWYVRRPLKFSLNNPSPNAHIDIDNILLMADDGREILTNGDFSLGLDRWFFTVDQDTPWHIWSMPVAVLFDQGWLGVIATGLLVILSLVRSGRSAFQGNIASAGVLASIAGILVIATLDTLVDSPRFLLLFLLLAWLGVTRWAQDDGRNHPDIGLV